MKQFTKLMAMLLFTAATQYSCINDCLLYTSDAADEQ